MLKKPLGIALFVLLFSGIQPLFGQQTGINPDQLSGQEDMVNTITTAVPFLMIAPDARGAGMGDAGVATLADGNSMHYNPAKFAFVQKDMGVSISYVPWLRELIDDINLAYLTGYMRLDKKQTVAGSIRYFSLGNITFTNDQGQPIGNFNPNEWALDVAYARLLSRKLSGGIALRFIYSNLTGGQYVEGTQSQAGKAAAADVSVYYEDKVKWFDKDSRLSFGANISNIGSKISYTENAEKDFIPVNLRLGAALTTQIDDYNSLGFTFEINKLLVPTPPIYLEDSTGFVLDDNGNQVVQYGKDPNVSVVSGIFQSFWDAPGVYENGKRSVLKEEMREINVSVGAEYWYAKQFALRAGFFHEHPTKGNREFFTSGMGLQLNVFGVDFAYLIPTGARNPLQNTLRFSLHFDLAQLAEQGNASRSKTAQ